MADRMHTLRFRQLLDWILQEYKERQSILGIHRSLFYAPEPDSPYATADLFGHYLATPIGPAAGPHTQLAQNILCAWLSGGRFIELKTVQVMDELEIPRPCIDMEDEGYNVEWSQELKLEQSADEYVKAWALIHVLRRVLGHEGRAPFGTVFNMSVGYNLEGIQSPPMTRFMDRLQDASAAIADIRRLLRDRYPQFGDIEIPSRLTNSVTLSTMHGCPPDEIERIACYLMEERRLHTTVKLNPTLLGEETVRQILRDELGFTEIQIPNAVFEHDLEYERAVKLIESLQQVAARQGLTFGVKLSNTLAMANHKGYLPGDEMYMSGRALYPVTMNLFLKLARAFGVALPSARGQGLRVSYSAGADALNTASILACGARPVTVASDLLRPGGYSRMVQYLEELAIEMQRRGASSLAELAEGALTNLERAAGEALQAARYKRQYHPYGLPKVDSQLGLFDCIVTPCVEQCAVRQDVPEYAWLIAQGEYGRAMEAILARNPLPGVTGHVCTHLCQSRCTRNSYDEPVAIRALKRFAVLHGEPPQWSKGTPARTSRRVAVIGSGPSGLAAAAALALNGVAVTVFEAQDRAGGMLAIAPAFRLPPEVVQADIDRIVDMGVQIELSHRVTGPPEALLECGFDAVYVACGLARDARLEIEGIDGEGVYTALDYLEQVAFGERPQLGERVLVVGGGNTAMDAARTAQRLTGRPATVVYRRTRAEMPAEEEEVGDLLAEGNRLVELASPTEVLLRSGQVVGLACVCNKLGAPGADGRRRPEPIPGSAFQLQADSVILAIGQRPDITFLDGSAVALRENSAISVDAQTGLAGVDGVYAGGDVVRGPAIIVQACADGRRAAESICARFGIACRQPACPSVTLSDEEVVGVKRARARKEPQSKPAVLPVAQRHGFGLVEQTLSEEAAQREAARCLQCSTVCDKCVEVCPNRANQVIYVSPLHVALPVLCCQAGKLIEVGEEPFAVTQARQIIHIADLCNECGNCATFCVHQGKPYEDKPRVYLRRSRFRMAHGNAFYVDGDTIWRREAGREASLSMRGGRALFENGQVCIGLSPALEVEEMTLKAPFEGLFSLKGVAEMAQILEGLNASLPYLPGMGRTGA